MPWDKSRRYLRRIYICTFICRRVGYRRLVDEGVMKRTADGATRVGTLLAGGVNTNLKIFSGVPLACKRHPPFISAPCRLKPNLHTLVHAHTCVRHTCRIDILRRTGYAVARRRVLVIYSVNSNKSHKFVRSVFTRRRRSSRVS